MIFTIQSSRFWLNHSVKQVFVSILLMIAAFATQSAEWTGQIQAEGRYFFEQGDFGQDQDSLSIAIEPEFYHAWEDTGFSVVFKPFYRWDSMDDERTHGDVRELLLTYVGDTWEVKAGLGHVFWGVAESQHLVDIINQTDFVENVDGEDKLGQPMLSFSTEGEWGLFQLFALPGFRERTFAGFDGRLRFPLVVDTDNPIYADSDEEHRLDGAIRWSKSLGDWDVGLSHFSGTSREPLFVTDLSNPLAPTLRPLYVTIDQTSVDIQATKDAWLWKLEAISRSGYDVDRYWAAIAGFEYSFYGITESGADLGVIMEYQTDSRDLLPGGFEQKDTIVTGFRLALNDVQSTEALLGLSFADGQRFYNLEASRRLGDSWKLIIEARFFEGIDDTKPMDSLFYPLRNDDYISISLEKYF
ncbi:MAG: hypothetical protein HWD86_11905 [Kangiellaceae bacterium]|nr:hypothetical protein [Kangiellaceae bacterium]